MFKCQLDPVFIWDKIYKTDLKILGKPYFFKNLITIPIKFKHLFVEILR